MMLDHLGLGDAATRLRRAIKTTLVQGEYKTSDLGGNASTEQYTQALVRAL
jgi:isocitrate/isopropylmalate dehydrogenase